MNIFGLFIVQTTKTTTITARQKLLRVARPKLFVVISRARLSCLIVEQKQIYRYFKKLTNLIQFKPYYSVVFFV